MGCVWGEVGAQGAMMQAREQERVLFVYHIGLGSTQVDPGVAANFYSFVWLAYCLSFVWNIRKIICRVDGVRNGSGLHTPGFVPPAAVQCSLLYLCVFLLHIRK